METIYLGSVFFRTRDIGMNSDPGTWEDRDNTVPKNIPDRPTMRELSAMISRQRVFVDGLDGAGVDRGSLNQIVDK